MRRSLRRYNRRSVRVANVLCLHSFAHVPLVLYPRLSVGLRPRLFPQRLPRGGPGLHLLRVKEQR